MISINRCVRRAFLCGTDPLTGTYYEHRRELIRQRMEFLASAMGVEVLAFSVMSNHLHIILNRPDVVSEWSDDEVAQRWWQLCPARKEKDGTPKEPTELDLIAIKGDAKQLVDLNPVRAGMATTPEKSDFTSAADRIADRSMGPSTYRRMATLEFMGVHGSSWEFMGPSIY